MSTSAPLPPPYTVLVVIYHLFIVPDYWPLSIRIGTGGGKKKVSG